MHPLRQAHRVVRLRGGQQMRDGLGEITDLCRWPGGGTSFLVERCADGGNFVLFGSNYQDVFAFLVLILVLVLRPSGLLGERVAERA